jgi:hypothetical protein
MRFCLLLDGRAPRRLNRVVAIDPKTDWLLATGRLALNPRGDAAGPTMRAI